MTDSIRLGLSAPYACNYLPNQQERVLFTLPEQTIDIELYQTLTNHNFRRTGDQLYRPYCDQCHACIAVRLHHQEFQPSKNQRRVQHKARHAGWTYRLQSKPTWQDYYPLYQRYISQRHADGVMYPPSPEHLDSLLHCRWLPVHTLEQYLDGELVGVMVLDLLLDGYSAVYSFFDPACKLSLGTLAILAGVEVCQQQKLPYLYLGYWVEHSEKMAYKARFVPQQRLIGQEWYSFG